MQLKTTTDYALRAVLYLGMTQRVTTAGEIAEKMNVPKNYLINLVGLLHKANIVKTQVGIYGGYYLARSPEEISLYDVIRVTEVSMQINRCLEKDSSCSRGHADDCPMRAVYRPLQDMLDYVFKHTTIADLLNGRATEKLARLLSIESDEA